MNVHGLEQFGEGLGEGAAMLDNVGEAEGGGGVLLGGEPLPILIAHQIDGAEEEVAACAGLGLDVHARAQEGRIVEDEGVGNDAFLENALFRVDVGEEEIEGSHALDQSRFQGGPFRMGNDQREEIKLPVEVAGFLRGRVGAVVKVEPEFLREGFDFLLAKFEF
ncbi:MAG: hypothetical protein HC904_03605 [Blastochloris sp.]|nr:hypothetical protein [Blastochloris sp.]